MSFYSTEQLTVLMSAQIGAALGSQDVTVFVVPNSQTQEPALFIRVNKPPIPQYKGETTIYGKALNLIYHLHRECNISRLLQTHGLSHLAVTEAKSLNLGNNMNTFPFLTEHVKVICDTLNTMTPSQNDEYIGHMISLNNQQFGS
jgi:hypothetical protein